MTRPALAVGTIGKIRFSRVSAGYRARALVRDPDGRTRDVERVGRSRASAEQALKVAIRDRIWHDGAGDVSRQTRVSDLAEAWFATLDRQAPTTKQAYRNRLDAQVIPALGHLRVQELSIGTVDRFMRAVSKTHGPAVAKMTRTVLSGMCSLAARHDALDRNPVRDASVIVQPRRAAPRALTVAEARQLLAMLTYDQKAVDRDLPDLVAFMLASGLRIGEAYAVTWDAVDLVAGRVEVRGTVVRLKGKGLTLRTTTKTAAGARVLALPSWALDLLRRRLESFPDDAEQRGHEAVFPAPLGGLRDPSNTQAHLRQAFAWAGVPWVTSHMFRKTTATLLDQAGLSARAIADQLGHSQPSITQNVYMGRKVASHAAAEALELLG